MQETRWTEGAPINIFSTFPLTAFPSLVQVDRSSALTRFPQILWTFVLRILVYISGCYSILIALHRNRLICLIIHAFDSILIFFERRYTTCTFHSPRCMFLHWLATLLLPNFIIFVKSNLMNSSQLHSGFASTCSRCVLGYQPIPQQPRIDISSL